MNYVAITTDHSAPNNLPFARATRMQTTIELEAKWGTDAQQSAILQAAIDAQLAPTQERIDAYREAIELFNALQSPYTRPVLVRTLEQVRASWEARELPREMPKMGLIARAWLLLVR